MRTAVIAIVLLLLRLAPAAGDAVRAGVSACDITPDTQRYAVPMAGYGARGGKASTGVHDPLQAKILYLENGSTRLAIVTTDLRSITPELKNQVLRKAGASGLTRENLMICASHNHSGPSIYPQQFWQLQFGAYDPAIVEAMTDRIAEALARARAQVFEARIGAADAMEEGFTRNRRWEYDRSAREASGESPQVHPRLWLLRVDDTEGHPRAILVNFATHPTILGADNFQISAEWPGALQRRLESEFPGTTVLYTNGAEGDQAPAEAQGADDFSRMEDFGTRLASRTAVLARSIASRPDFDIAYRQFDAPLGEPVFSEASKIGPYAFMEPMALAALPRHAEIQVFRIGDIGLIGVPGEAICEVGLAAENAARAAGIAEPVVVGLANDYIGYIVNAREYAHGGYEVDQRSYYGPTLGERIAQWVGQAARGETP